MSSTQWGVVETVWAEGSVAGSMGAALATLLLCLWACLYGNRGLTFCKQADAQVHIDLHSRACSEVNFVIVLPSTAYWVIMSGVAVVGAGGGRQEDFQLTKFALSVLEFQGSIRAVLNRDTKGRPLLRGCSRSLG